MRYPEVVSARERDAAHADLLTREKTDTTDLILRAHRPQTR
jgi:hypothetical protein